ncbi:MAG: hypothetical protein GX387_03680 [Clostridium sp.]|jgi:hypothetical protein|nr:hypothetical protein [Clostridium sp.]
MKISVNELKTICKLLLDTAEKSGFREFEFDTDYYWFIPSDEREVFDKNLPNPCVGSINELLKIIEENR